MDLVDYDDLKAIEDKLKNNPNYCAVLLEPI
jgi:ornithine--oxo-acid transaminase